MPPAQPLTVTRPELLADGRDDAFRETVHDLLAFGARLEEVRNRFGAHIGLSGVQYTLLIAIRQLGGDAGVGPKDVAAHLSLSAPFVTTEAAKLVSAGLVAKRAHPDDQRRVRLTVTADGHARLARLAPLQRTVNDALFEPVAAEGIERLRTLADGLRTGAERALALSDTLVGSKRADR